MYLTKICLSFLNTQAGGIFKVLIITKLDNTFESLTGTGKPFNYSLSFSIYHRPCKKFSNTCPQMFLFIYIVSYVYRAYFGKRK